MNLRPSIPVILLLAGVSPSLHAGLLSDAITMAQAASERAKLQRVDADCRTISAALQMYKIHNGTFPTGKQGLKALVAKPAEAPLPRRWLKLMDKVPLDPWEREYGLVVRKKEGKETFFVTSRGPDPDDAADDLEHPVDPPENKK